MNSYKMVVQLLSTYSWCKNSEANSLVIRLKSK